MTVSFKEFINEEQLDELSPIGLFALGAGVLAADNIVRTHMRLRKKEAEQRAAGKMTYREKRARIRQRIKDKADPKSEVNKNIKRKQQTRKRHMLKIASTLEPGQSTRRQFTKSSWAASDSKKSREFSSNPNDKRKGVVIKRDKHGKPSMRFEWFYW